ncbi:MAG: ATP-binding protein [Bacteroidales bacterium]
MILRALQKVIEGKLFKGKAIVILGPRQVGKTTLLNQLISAIEKDYILLNCDDPEVRMSLSNANTKELELLIGNKKLVLIDEAQRIKNAGLTLKIMIDNFNDVQLIVTGSSALEIGNEINEPLTGRKYEYKLFPLSTKELIEDKGFLMARQMLENRLIYGSYPDIINNVGEAKELLYNITDSYLFKDILSMENIHKPALLEKILTALALQLGQEVSFNEIAQLTGADSKTVERYVELLEKTFVIFRLPALSRNMRNELKKSKKIYFFDNGIRNTIIRTFNPLNLRQDTGALWENFFVSEKVKSLHYQSIFSKLYFWRTTHQQEIDLIEEKDGIFDLFEIKWSDKRKVKFPASFLKNYNTENSNVITPENYFEFL